MAQLTDGNQEVQDSIMAVLPKMMERMYWINCQGTEATYESAGMVEDAYGFDVGEEQMAARGKTFFKAKGELVDWKPEVRGQFAEEGKDLVDNFASV